MQVVQPGNLTLWTFVLGAVVIASAMLAVHLFLFNVKAPTRAQYRVVIVLMFFALSCITSLLFISTVKVDGTVAGFTVSVAGPAALWLLGLFAFLKYVPEETLYRNVGEDQTSWDAISNVVMEIEKRQEWRMYSEWKDGLREGFSQLFDTDETGTLKSLLHTVYFTHSLEKLNEPRITTLWMYFAKSVVKLQRIRGRKEGAAAWIRFGSNPTADSAHAKSVFLVGEAGKAEIRIARGFTEVENVEYRGLQQVKFEPVDCMIVTLYDDPPYEDYLLVDVKRFSKGNSGNVEIGVASFDKQIQTTSLWTLKQPIFTPDGEVPLAVRRVEGHFHDGVHSVEVELRFWLTAVDKLLETPRRNITPTVIDALMRIRAAAAEGAEIAPGDMSFAKLASAAEKAKTSLSYSTANTHDVTMLLVRMID